MVVGRPRTTTPTVEEVIELGKDLVAWATEETDDIRTSFSFWYALKHRILYNDWKLLKQKEEFHPYYECARAALAKKLHSDAIEKGMAHRYMRMYDRELFHDEEATADLELQRKKDLITHSVKLHSETGIAIPDSIVEQYSALMTQFKSRRSTSKDLKTDDIKSNADKKS